MKNLKWTHLEEGFFYYRTDCFLEKIVLRDVSGISGRNKMPKLSDIIASKAKEMVSGFSDNST